MKFEYDPLYNFSSSAPPPFNNPTNVIIISDADGRRALRSRRSESTSARQNKEHQKLENELKLLREQINISIERIKTLENQLSEKSKYYLRRVSNN